MAKQYRKLHPLKFYRDYLIQNIRPDGRDFDKYRPVVVNANSISTADGSAIVKIGETCVVCGIKAEFCMPKAETPDEGFIIPNVELPALCSPKFKPGPPSDQAQVASVIVNNIIKDSKCVDLKTLCIAKEKLAWCLYADLVCIDHDGALIDACVLALFTALKTLKLPEVVYDAAIDNKLVNMENLEHIILHSIPLATTFVIFDDTVVLTDPTAEEEALCTGVVTVVIKDNELCSLQKPGGSPASDEQMMKCIKDSVERSKSLLELIEFAVNRKKNS